MENRVTKGYKVLMLSICGIGGYISFMTIWLFYSYYDLIQNYFGVTSTQMGYIGTITGLVMLVGYTIGGIIHDKIPVRASFFITMIWTIINFLALAFIASYAIYLITVFISCFFVGISLALFYAIIKKVSTPKSEGANNGIYWAIYSICGTVIGLIGASLVERYGLAGWRPLMFLFAGITAAVTVAGGLTLDASKFNDWSVIEANKETTKFEFKYLIKIIRSPEFIIAGIIYFGMLMISAAGVYAVSMMSNVYMVPLAIVTIIGTIRANFARVIIAPISGVLIDKLGSSMQVIRVLLVIALVGIATFFIFPVSQDYFWVAIVLVASCTIAYAMEAPCWNVPMTEIMVPVAYHGTAVGVYNAIGCIPDIFIYVLCGSWLDKYGNITGNRYIMTFIGAALVITFILTLIETKLIKKKRSQFPKEA